VDLVESMAAATKRSVKWSGGRISHGHNGGTCTTKQSTFRSRLKTRGLHSNSAGKQGSVYILHNPDALAHTLRLREAIVTEGKRCYVGGNSTSAEDMKVCFEHVAGSDYVILLQTSTVLMHPWPLLATYHASLAGVPLVCVAVAEGGYEFGAMEHHLKHLSERLDQAALQQMASVLAGWTPPRTVTNLQSKLFSLIPQIISVVYHPSGTNNEIAATIRDIHDKQSLLQERESSIYDAEKFLVEARRQSLARTENSVCSGTTIV
jgi:hypothetical protein